MKSLSKFLALPWQEKYLVCKTFLLLVFIKTCLLALPFSWFKSLYNSLLRRPLSSSRSASQTARLIYFIKGIAANVPLGLTCLPQALALKYYLNTDTAAKLIIGVNLENTFKAHAWVEKDAKYLIGDLPFETYTPLWTWT